MDISFWIIVPWSLKTVEILEKIQKIYTELFLSTLSKELLENIALNVENCQNWAKILKI